MVQTSHKLWLLKWQKAEEILKIDDHEIVRKQKNFGGIIFSDKAKLSFKDYNLIKLKLSQTRCFISRWIEKKHKSQMCSACQKRVVYVSHFIICNIIFISQGGFPTFCVRMRELLWEALSTLYCTALSFPICVLLWPNWIKCMPAAFCCSARDKNQHQKHLTQRKKFSREAKKAAYYVCGWRGVALRAQSTLSHQIKEVETELQRRFLN